MRHLIFGGLAAAVLGTAMLVTGALPASAQVARPQSALAIDSGNTDNSDLLTLVQDRDRGNRAQSRGREGGNSARGDGRRDGGSARSGGRDGGRSYGNNRNWSNNGNWRRNHRYGYRGYGGYGTGFALGLGIGAPLAYSYAPRYYGGGDDEVAYCMSRFQSYDPQSGTYLGYDGFRHPCP